MTAFRFFDYLVIGSINNEFIIDLYNQPHHNVMGGSALYSAGGIRCWNNRIAVSGHAHTKNQNALNEIHEKYQVNFQGIQFHADYPDDRLFLGYISPLEAIIENPVAFYASRKIAFPKKLIDYLKSDPAGQTGEKTKLLPADIPPNYWDVSAALLCPADLSTQLQLTSMLLKTSTKILVIHSSASYMKLTNFETMPVLLKDATTFITTTRQLSALFLNRTQNIWEMAEYLCSLGCEHVIMDDGQFGHYLYDGRTKKRFQFPLYPVKMTDPTGLADSFAGGYLVGLKKKFDPVEALLYGSVTASFKAEGTGPFYGVEAIPGLLQSRLNFAQELLIYL